MKSFHVQITVSQSELLTTGLHSRESAYLCLNKPPYEAKFVWCGKRCPSCVLNAKCSPCTLTPATRDFRRVEFSPPRDPLISGPRAQAVYIVRRHPDFRMLELSWEDRSLTWILPRNTHCRATHVEYMKVIVQIFTNTRLHQPRIAIRSSFFWSSIRSGRHIPKYAPGGRTLFALVRRMA